MSKNKTASVIAMFLVFAFAISLVALPAANAHTPPWQITTYAYIHVAPNPVGVDQQAEIVVLIDTALNGALISNDIRAHNFKLTITKPDKTTATVEWPVAVDAGSSAYTLYTPDQVGTYTLKFDYAGQVYTWSGAYQNDTYMPSTATTTLTVQQEPIAKLPFTPLPTEYWTRPIEGENILWDSISSNWLSGAATSGIWQKDGSAPRSAHIMWTKPVELGGIVGGSTIPDQTYYSGFSYETRFGNPIIIGGILYYNRQLNHAGSGGGYFAVDLRTGEEIWHSDDLNTITTAGPSKGQLYEHDSPNQHGTVGGILWQVVGSTWNAYDAFTGKYIFNMTGVPSGTEVYTDQGEIVRYILTYNSTKRSGRLALWNNTAAITSAGVVQGSPGWRPLGQTIDASTSTAYSWNVTIPDLSGSSAPAIVGVIPGDLILGRSSNVALTSSPNPNTNPWTMWAISDKPTSRGNLLWIQNYSAPAGNITRMLAWQPIDPVNRVWTMTDFETGQRLGYSLATGSLLWGPVGPQDIGFQYYASREGAPAYGNLYVTGYGGIIYCYSTNNGTLLWTYGNGGEGNSTNSGDETPWGLYPTHAAAFADGIIYTMSGEHSPNTPLYKGYRVRAVDAYTGKELWTLLDWSASGLGTSVAPVAIADGYLVYNNAYDGQIYCIGKGPSATTAEAPMTAITAGDSVVIRGTVTDQCAGAKKIAQTLGLQNGVAAVSDASMGQWMEYLYMQKPHPTNAIGVPVTIDAVDPNGNFIHIGNATSDTSSLFSYAWTTPDIPGKYTVIATFAGSESYWPSYAETAMVVQEAPPTPTPPPAAAPLPPFDLYIAIATVVIVIAIAIATILLLRKRP